MENLLLKYRTIDTEMCHRKEHIPYVFKALIVDNIKEIGDLILCQDGKN